MLFRVRKWVILRSPPERFHHPTVPFFVCQSPGIVLPPSTIHLDISVLAFAYGPDPKYVVAADEYLTQGAGEVVLDVLLRVGQLDVHVAVDRNPVGSRSESASQSPSAPPRHVCVYARVSRNVCIDVVKVVMSHSLPLYSVSPHLRRTQISLFTLSYSCQSLSNVSI